MTTRHETNPSDACILVLPSNDASPGKIQLTISMRKARGQVERNAKKSLSGKLQNLQPSSTAPMLQFRPQSIASVSPRTTITCNVGRTLKAGEVFVSVRRIQSQRISRVENNYLDRTTESSGCGFENSRGEYEYTSRCQYDVLRTGELPSVRMTT